MTNPYQLPFEEAIDYFAQKTGVDTDSWKDDIDQRVAFTVANAKGSLLAELQQAVQEAIEQGISTLDFRQIFDKIVTKYGKDWDRTKNVAWRSQLIYSQNLRQAQEAGRYAQQTTPEMLKRRPYWWFRHGDSRVPRPTHLAMDNAVFAADSINFYPPCGFECKCRIFTLSEAEFKRRGFTQADLIRGQKLADAFKPDPGFEGKPGKLSLEDKKAIIANLPSALQSEVLKELK